MLRLITSIILACALAVSAAAQRNLDPSSCYSGLLQRTELYTHSERLKLAMLSIIDETTFNSVKDNATLAAMFEGIPFNLGFQRFQEARRKYYEQHSLNVDHESATAISSIGLDRQAGDLFETCIRGLANSQYGMSVLSSSQDEGTSSLQTFWKPITPGQAVLIEDSAIVNGVVMGAPSGKVFPKGTSIKDSKTRIIKRTDPNKPIIITIDLDPQTSLGEIVIPPIPAPVRCEDVTIPHVINQVVGANEYLNGKEGHNGSKFVISKTVNGKVTDVSCAKMPPGDFMELDDPSGRGSISDDEKTGTCSGSKNGAPREVRITIHWEELTTRCVTEPWKTGQENHPAVLAATK